ncbi:MAG: hypothetical protein HY816_09790 [Candidatus Wallbacteria bacterium]|nr:hypothetical protein [Candidatus Wallbacteria bacterium]
MQTQEVNQRLVKQDVPGLRRRQFQGDKMELAVWQNADGDIIHFRMVMLPNLVVDFEYGKGFSTGHAVLTRLRRRYFLSPEVPGEDPMSLPDIEKAVADERPELTTLRLAFEKLADNPPSTQKRSVSFVAHALYQVLTDPRGLEAFLGGKLADGADSVFGDADAVRAMREAAERKQKYQGVFGKLMSMLTDDDD